MPSPLPDPARRSDRARTAVLTATRELLVEAGWRATTVEAVAARAGVGKQTIYRWWPSRAAVAFDALLAGSADADGSTALPDTGDVERDLRTVLHATLAELRDPATDRLQRTVTAEIQHDVALAGDLRDRLLRPQTDAVAARLRLARSAGELREDVDVDVLAEALLGPVLHRWLLRTGPLEDAWVDRVLDQALAGVRPPTSG